MKNYDSTRQQLREKGWYRADKTFSGRHIEIWRRINGNWSTSAAYDGACKDSGITPQPTEKRRDPRPPYRRKKGLQAKCIGYKHILKVVAELGAQWEGNWAFTWDIFARYEDIPKKVVLAKLRSLIRRKMITGCVHTSLPPCRGDFELTELGYKILRARSGLARGSRPEK